MTTRSSAARRARQAASLVCAAAVGALLFSVHVATSVFRDMPTDRALAGRIAGRSFTGAYAIAGLSAVVAVVVVLMQRTQRTQRTRRATLDRIVAVSLLVVASLQLLWIALAIGRRGTGWPGSFASLHATAGVLHLALVVLALFLAWRLLDDGPPAASGPGTTSWSSAGQPSGPERSAADSLRS